VAVPRWLPPVALVAAGAGVLLRWMAEPGLWLDEALGANLAALPLGDLVDALRHDGHPPLYPVVLKGWMALFGEGDRAVRSLSMVVSTATLPLAWMTGRRLAGAAAGWLAVAMLALSPFAIRYGSEARMYALVQLLVVAGVLLVASGLSRPERRPSGWVLAGTAAVTAALLLTHYWSIWLVVATIVLLALLMARDPSRRPAARRLLAAMGVGCVVFLPWLPVLLDQATNTGTPWGRTRNPLAVVGMTLNGAGGNLDVDGGARIFQGQLLGAALAALVVLAVLGRAGDSGARGLVVGWPPQAVPGALAGVGALTLALGALGCLVSGSAFASRYAAAVLVLFLLAVAVGVAAWPVAGIAVVLALLLPLGLLGGVRAATEPRTQIDSLVGAVNERAAPGDLVVVCPDQLGPATGRRLRDDVTAVAYPDLAGMRLVDWRDYEARHRAADPAAVAAQLEATAGERTIWLLWSGGYRWLDDQCERLAGELGRARTATVVAGADPTILEHATLVGFGRP
jgi:hypothetical protein